MTGYYHATLKETDTINPLQVGTTFVSDDKKSAWTRALRWAQDKMQGKAKARISLVFVHTSLKDATTIVNSQLIDFRKKNV